MMIQDRYLSPTCSSAKNAGSKELDHCLAKKLDKVAMCMEEVDW